jgi:hypothetical protein
MDRHPTRIRSLGTIHWKPISRVQSQERHDFKEVGFDFQLAVGEVLNLDSLLLWQGVIVFFLAAILSTWLFLQRDIRPDMRNKPLTPVGRSDEGRGLPNIGVSTVVGIILLAVPIVAFCFAFGWVVEESWYHVLWSPLVLVGFATSGVFWLHQTLISPEAALLPTDLPAPKRDDILRVFAAVFFKDGSTSVVR